jgi:hypothetical protein
VSIEYASQELTEALIVDEHGTQQSIRKLMRPALNIGRESDYTMNLLFVSIVSDQVLTNNHVNCGSLSEPH